MSGFKAEGTVKWFNAIKGFGFIEDGKGVEHFVHYSNIEMDGYKSLNEGERVEFEPRAGKDGRPAAFRVKRLY